VSDQRPSRVAKRLIADKRSNAGGAPTTRHSAMIAATNTELLSVLPASEQQQLDRHLRPVTLRCGSVLHEMGHSIERVYFPETGVISLVINLTNGETIESAMVGWDGAIGGFDALHQRLALSKAVVQ